MSPSPTSLTLAGTRRRVRGFDDTRIYVISGTTATNYYSASAGETGSSAAGFGVAWLGRVVTLPTVAQMLTHKSKGDATPYSGWELYCSAAGDLTFYVVNTSGGFVASRVRRVTSNDVGKMLLIVGQFETPGASRCALYVDRALANPGSFSSVSTIAISPNAHDMGTMYGATPAVSFEPAGQITWRGVMTEAQLQTQIYDATRTARQLPKTLTSATLAHRWSLRDELAKTTLTPVHGAQAPASLADTITAAAGDAMARVGTAQTISALDPNAARLWNWETSAIFFGASGFTGSSYYESNDANGVMPGVSTGFFSYVLARLDSQAVASATRYLLGQDVGMPGHSITTTGTNSMVSFKAGNAGAQAVSPSATLAAVDVGKMHLFVGVFDAAGKSRLYLRRAEQGSGSAALSGAYTSYTGRTWIGARSGGVPADGWTIMGAGYGVGVPTLAQIQALHDACVSGEAIQAISGMTTVMWDLSGGARNNGGALPATYTDSIGSTVLNRVGTPVIGSQYARVWGW